MSEMANAVSYMYVVQVDLPEQHSTIIAERPLTDVVALSAI